jgi:hypothetical protein
MPKCITENHKLDTLVMTLKNDCTGWQIQCMRRHHVDNHFIYPPEDDIHVYSPSDIICVLPNPTEGRHSTYIFPPECLQPFQKTLR